MLTKKQKKVLDYVESYGQKKGFSPSHDEIRKHLKLSSVSTVNHYLKILQEKKYINHEKNIARSIEIGKKENLINIPFKGYIAAGQPIEVVEEFETIAVQSSLFSHGELFALGVKGDSMIDEGILDGDTIIVRKQNTVENGEIAVALINNNEVTLKKIYQEKNRIRLQPANPKLKPFYVKEVIIQGKVISTFRNIEKQEKKDGKIKLNNIYNENCLDTMAKMPDNFIDMTVTSPPYDDMRKYSGNKFSEFELIVKELYRVTKNGGIVVWVIGDQTIKGNETGTSFKHALYFKQIGFNLFDTMIYLKPPRGAVGNNNTYWQTFEYMFVFSKGQPKTINLIRDRENKDERNGDNSTKRLHDGSLLKQKRGGYSKYGRRTNAWEYLIGKGHSSSDKIAYKHPAIFPEKLAQDHIISWSKKDEIIYDPFMGSGTTAKMAILNNRKFVGSELSCEYCEIAQKRIEYLQ
ncbi:MAG: transcriptional repressor LexA [Candidatus Staskawiczbacteria bacterium]|nr:transcriptional repressor LexA [Candidatus Staskawiczbacteria bacterium]